MSSSGRSTQLLLLVGAGFLLAVNINLAKAGAEAGASPLVLALWMHVGAGLVLLVVALSRGERPSMTRPYLVAYLVSGAVGFAFPNALGFKVAAEAGPAYGSILYALSPFFTYALAILFGMDRFALLRSVGLGLGLIGTLIVVVARFDLSHGSESGWVLLGLAVPVSVALGNVLRTLFWPTGASALSLAPGALLTAGLLLCPFALGPGGAGPGPSGWAPTIVLAQIATATFFYGLYFRLQKLAGPVYLSQIGYVATAFGVAIAVAFFQDVVSAVMLFGIACIGAGIVFVTRTASSSHGRS